MGRGASGRGQLPTIRVEHWNGIARIRLSGELDLSGRNRLQRALGTAQKHGTRGIWVDLSEVSFMDTSALSVLLRAHRRANKADRKLIVRGARDQVWSLFQLGGVHEVFKGANSTRFPGSPKKPADWSMTPPKDPSDG